MIWAVLILAAFVGLVLFVVADTERMRRRVEEEADVFARTRAEIRGLPETPDRPYDWQLEDAA